MANSEKIVRFWRGTRDSYNIIKGAGKLDYWTRYSVKEGSGAWTEYYGDNPISVATGQLLPVIDIVEALPDTLNPGDRYLVGHDANAETATEATYYLVEIYPKKDPQGVYGVEAQINPFTDKYSVRVRNRGLMNYQLVDGIMKTYDQVDCGLY